MKKISLLIIILIATKSLAQNVFIPYKSGNKFGLCDETGKIVLAPKYDNVKYLQKDFFKYENYNTLNSSSNVIGASDKIQMTSGLIYKNSPIIKEKKFTHYEILEPFILAFEYNEDQIFFGQNKELFNIEGKRLISESISSAKISNEGELGKLPSETPQEILITIHPSSYRTSIGVYNKEKKIITHWLLKNLKDIQVDKATSTNTVTHILYEDSTKKYFKTRITLEKNKYKIFSTTQMKEEEVESYLKDKYYSNRPIGISDDYNMEIKDRELANALRYHFRNDSLVYSENRGVRKYIKLPKDIELIFNNTTDINLNKYYNYTYNYYTHNQSTSIIYKKDNKLGIIIKDTIKEAVYDSLIYLTGTNTYLAGKINRDKMYFGIINEFNQVIVPIKYDSIKTTFNEYSFKINTSDKTELKIKAEPIFNSTDNFVNKYIQTSNPNYFQVYQAGKTGFIDFKNSIVIPIEYDLICKGNSQLIDGKVGFYFILKKDNKYGLATVTTENGRYIMNKKLAPIFRYIPLTYFEDYYGKQGFNLYKLYKENGEFAGYADKSGREFFKN